MFSFSQMARQPRAYRPHCEALEERLCPTWPEGILAPVLPHLTLNATVLAGHTVQFSGTVTGGSVAGYNIWISGAVSASAVSDSNGNFSCTTDQANLGAVTAVGVDQSLLNWTDMALATIGKSTPTLTMSVAYGANHDVTLSGLLTDLDAGGRTIMFTGAAGTTAVTDSTGHYSVTTPASSLGSILALETDLWGQLANANVFVSNSAAVIQSFTAEHISGDVWTFRGTVADESPAGLIVHLGGLSCLEGREATVQSDGSFEITVVLGSGDAGGTATAIVTDWWEVNSFEVSTTLP